MVFTDFGKSGLALMMTGSYALPNYIAIGSGSGTKTAFTDKLVYEVSRRIATTTDTSTFKRVTWTGDWTSVEMSGTNLREFEQFAGSTLSPTILSNADFESAFTSGTDWWFNSGGTALMSGGQWTGWKTESSNSGRIFWAGSNDACVSGTTCDIRQNLNCSGLHRIGFDYYFSQPGSMFLANIYCGGSNIGSLYTTGGTISGTKFGILYSGTNSLKFELTSIQSGSPVIGSHYFAIDNLKTYNSGKPWLAEGFAPITFDGTNELQIQTTVELF